MANAKEEVIKLLEGLPEEASLEDIQYHLYVLQCIARGRQDAKQGGRCRRMRPSGEWPDGSKGSLDRDCLARSRETPPAALRTAPQRLAALREEGSKLRRNAVEATSTTS